jgi:hypothetical protein
MDSHIDLNEHESSSERPSMGDPIDNLDDLSTEAREGLNHWLALRLLEHRHVLKIPVDDDDLRDRMEHLVERGDVEVQTVRHFVLWTRPAYGLTGAGRQRLAAKRVEIEELHAEIGGAIATGGKVLADKGISPGVLLFERMILMHHRFDDERSGFFTRCQGLRRYVRTLSTEAYESSDSGLIELLGTIGVLRSLLPLAIALRNGL